MAAGTRVGGLSMADGGDLVAFLRERLEEDERVARAAADENRPHDDPTPGEHWEHHEGWAYVRTIENESIEVVGPEAWSHEIDESTGRHIARHDPARVLREVQAKRKITEDLAAAFDRSRRHPGDAATSADLLAMVRTAQTLAAVYSDHPDYRQEWAA